MCMLCNASLGMRKHEMTRNDIQDDQRSENVAMALGQAQNKNISDTKFRKMLLCNTRRPHIFHQNTTFKTIIAEHLIKCKVENKSIG